MNLENNIEVPSFQFHHSSSRASFHDINNDQHDYDPDDQQKPQVPTSEVRNLLMHYDQLPNSLFSGIY